MVDYPFKPEDLQFLLDKEARQKGFQLAGEPVAGFHDRCRSQKAVAGDKAIWLQLRQSRSNNALPYIVNALASDKIEGVKKPQVMAYSQDRHKGQPYGLVVLNYMPDTLMSPKAWPIDMTVPHQDWWNSLQQSLDVIHASTTKTVSIADHEVSELLQKHYDYIPDGLPRRQTLHGDLHWANLGQDKTFYDWEYYGTGPYGLDEATLYFYSYQHSELRDKIENVFAPLFEENDFQKTLLYYCASVKEMVEVGFTVLSPFLPSADTIAQKCLTRLDATPK